VRKTEFYSLPRVTREYDERRFGGRSGEWVNARELGFALSLLPPAGRVLDLACGTGRLSRVLAARSYQVVGADYSTEMLAHARNDNTANYVRADAFHLPFSDQTFDAVCALRFAFHYPDLGPFLQEARRVLRPGGALVFDTYRWSPRALLGISSRAWGGRVYAFPSRRVLREAARTDLRPRREHRCFFFTPYLYRVLPYPLVVCLHAMENISPRLLLVRSFWRLERPAGPP
jgi:SAM-dependent methyltransferase